MKILFVLLIAGTILSILYFFSWKQNPIKQIALWLAIALLIAFALWIYGYGDLLRMFLKW